MWTIIKINVLNPASMEFLWDFSRFWYLTHNDYQLSTIKCLIRFYLNSHFSFKCRNNRNTNVWVLKMLTELNSSSKNP